MRQTTVAQTIGLVLLLVGLGGMPGCGSPAKAEPMDVTYYYLPG